MNEWMRPRVGISSCLLGNEVRYDGTHKLDAALISDLGHSVEWIAICPEVEVGMGAPREPIQLVVHAEITRSHSSFVRLVGVESGEDWTTRMHDWARARARELAAIGLSGYVLKARSPSCGLRDVPVHQLGEAPHAVSTGPGVFASILLEEFPGLPMDDEEHLRAPAARAEFLRRVVEYHGFRRQ